MTTTLEWKPITEPPDDDITVLVAYVSEPGCPLEVWPGWKEGDSWFCASGGTIDSPRFWAHMPEAPNP